MKALVTELKNRVTETEGITFDTIYFGGGTPSVLRIDELVQLYRAIAENYSVAVAPEITLEANPDDLNKSYLGDLRKYTPVNRISIGIQSFNDRDLTLLNRRHTASEAIHSIECTKEIGFTNINIDLIYGIPGMTTNLWEKNLGIFSHLNIPHLSAYHLTIEPKTVFGHHQKKGKIRAVNEEISLEQFELLMDFAEQNGYDHYEISNFARPDFYSEHNLGCWTGKPYLGFGPSAHSYSKTQRRWNIANNTLYCESIENNRTDYFESEEIDSDKAYNEYLLTSLRTKRGIDIQYILQTFGQDYAELCNSTVQKFLDQDIVHKEGTQIILNRKGKFIADFVIQELMAVG